MKKIIYALILPLVVVSGLVFANRKTEKEPANKPAPKPLSAAERNAARKKWEATPDGIKFKKWEASPAGKKVYASIAKIRKHTRDFSDMEAIVTSLSLPPGSRLGFGVMVKINDADYILSFGPEKRDNDFFSVNNEFEQLHTLKVNDTIAIRSRGISYAPKYAYPIVAGNYVQRNGKILFISAPPKGGC